MQNANAIDYKQVPLQPPSVVAPMGSGVWGRFGGPFSCGGSDEPIHPTHPRVNLLQPSNAAAPMGSGVRGRFGGPFSCGGVSNPIHPTHPRVNLLRPSNAAAPMGSGVRGRFGGPFLCGGSSNPVRLTRPRATPRRTPVNILVINGELKTRLTGAIYSVMVPMQPQKTVVGITTPHTSQRRNRATYARFFCFHSHSAVTMGSDVRCRFGGPLLCGGCGNSVRPARPNLPLWQVGVLRDTQRFAMTKEFAPAHCAQILPDSVSFARLAEATQIARQIVARDGPKLQPILTRLEAELFTAQQRPSTDQEG